MIKNTFTSTITLYNSYPDKSSGKSIIRFKRTVLKNCYFDKEIIKDIRSDRFSGEDSFICRIPENDAYTDDYQGEEGRFTLKPGDIIVEGEVFDEIEDMEGKRPSDLLKKYSGRSFSIEEVSKNTLLKGFPHYRASKVYRRREVKFR